MVKSENFSSKVKVVCKRACLLTYLLNRDLRVKKSLFQLNSMKLLPKELLLMLK